MTTIEIPVCSNPKCEALQIKLIRMSYEKCAHCGAKNVLKNFKEENSI